MTITFLLHVRSIIPVNVPCIAFELRILVVDFSVFLHEFFRIATLRKNVKLKILRPYFKNIHNRILDVNSLYYNILDETVNKIVQLRDRHQILLQIISEFERFN